MRGTAHMRPVRVRQFWGFCSRPGCRDPSQIPTHTDFSVPGVLSVTGFLPPGGFSEGALASNVTAGLHIQFPRFRGFCPFRGFSLLLAPALVCLSGCSRRGLRLPVIECLVLHPPGGSPSAQCLVRGRGARH
jgi:hypothetical protein